MLIKKSPKEQPGLVIAANNSYAKGKLSADYICDGVSDDEQFQTILNKIASSTGGTIKVLAGTYIFDRCVELKGNLKLIF